MALWASKKVKCTASVRLFFALTAKMEDYLNKLKHFSKLDFQSKLELINTGRPMPELKDGTEDNTVFFFFQRIGTPEKTGCVGVLRETAFSAFPAFCSQRQVTMSGLQRDFVTWKNLPRSLSRHESSTTHIQSQIALNT